MKVVELQLACELSEYEIQLRAQELGTAVIERDDIDDQRRTAMKIWKDRLEAVEHRIRRLSKVVREKQEYRMVACAVRFHTPEIGVKQLVRTDTGEIVREEPMTDQERQNNLFGEAPEQEVLPGCESPEEACGGPPAGSAEAGAEGGCQRRP